MNPSLYRQWRNKPSAILALALWTLLDNACSVFTKRMGNPFEKVNRSDVYHHGKMIFISALGIHFLIANSHERLRCNFNSILPDLWRRSHPRARTRFWHCWWLFFSWSKIFSFPFIKHAFSYNTVFNGFFEGKSNVVYYYYLKKS